MNQKIKIKKSILRGFSTPLTIRHKNNFLSLLIEICDWIHVKDHFVGLKCNIGV